MKLRNLWLLPLLLLGLRTVPASAQQPTPPRLNDAQIAAIVVAANEVDMEIAAHASTKATHAKVKEFATRMATGHHEINESAIQIAQRLGIVPQENDVSRTLRARGKQSLAELEKLSAGPDFDRRYIQNEITYHKMVVEAMDQGLIPLAQNPEFKKALIDVRPRIAAHLEHAQHLFGDYLQSH